MRERPLSITIIACLLATGGVVGLVYHLVEFKAHSLHNDIVWVSLIRLLAIMAGIFMLRGSNWARWLAMAWIAFHVVISYFHSWQELALHAIFFAGFAFFLFRPEAGRYFHRAEQK